VKISDIALLFGDLVHGQDSLGRDIGLEPAARISAKSGITQRYLVSPGSDIIDLARKFFLSESRGRQLQECEFVIVVSEYVEHRVPPPSALILRQFDLNGKLVLDLNRGCSGFCEALVISNAFFSSRRFTKGVIITAENYSKLMSRANRSVAPIFSDAVAFTFLEADDRGRFYSSFGSYHTLSDNLMYDRREQELFMNGAALVSFVKSEVIPDLARLIKFAASERKAVDYLFAHQGSALVIQALNSGLQGCAVRAEFLSGEIGNINSSSIPFLIKEKLLSRRDAGDYFCLLSGFGVGLSFCNILLDLKT